LLSNTRRYDASLEIVRAIHAEPELPYRFTRSDQRNSQRRLLRPPTAMPELLEKAASNRSSELARNIDVQRASPGGCGNLKIDDAPIDP
jgi:hypothetical protein